MTSKDISSLIRFNSLYIIVTCLMFRFLPFSSGDFSLVIFFLVLVSQTYLNIRILKSRKLLSARRIVLYVVGNTMLWLVLGIIINLLFWQSPPGPK